RFSTSARSNSAVKIPLRPDFPLPRLESPVLFWPSSPLVRTISIWTSIAHFLRNAHSAIRVCARARSLARLPSTILGSGGAWFNVDNCSTATDRRYDSDVRNVPLTPVGQSLVGRVPVSTRTRYF